MSARHSEAGPIGTGPTALIPDSITSSQVERVLGLLDDAYEAVVWYADEGLAVDWNLAGEPLAEAIRELRSWSAASPGRATVRTTLR